MIYTSCKNKKKRVRWDNVDTKMSSKQPPTTSPAKPPNTALDQFPGAKKWKKIPIKIGSLVGCRVSIIYIIKKLRGSKKSRCNRKKTLKILIYFN